MVLVARHKQRGWCVANGVGTSARVLVHAKIEDSTLCDKICALLMAFCIALLVILC
jgi:hypothetical protein